MKGEKIMKYGYIRVSTDKQTVDNQKFEINQYCAQNNMQIDEWVEEVESGTVAVQKRQLQRILNKVQNGDEIICTELSRLGRNMMMIMSLLNECINREVSIYTVKEHYHLDNNMNSKVLAFAFSLCAEVERNLISQRTKEALKLRKAMGIQLGRRPGSKNKHYKLDKHKEYIINRWEENKSLYYIAKHLHCKHMTLKLYINRLIENGEIVKRK